MFSGKNYSVNLGQLTVLMQYLVSSFGWNDMIASCNYLKQLQAKFSLHCSFGGWNKEYGPGEYPSVNRLGMTGGISSIKMGSDLK